MPSSEGELQQTSTFLDLAESLNLCQSPQPNSNVRIRECAQQDLRDVIRFAEHQVFKC